jgi:WD40 repeat protein
MVSTGGGTAVLWDLTVEPPAAEPLYQFDSDTPQIIWDAMISPDSATIGLATESAGVLIIDRASKDLVATGATEGSSDLLSGAFLTNDRLIVGDGLGMARIVDRTTGDQIGEELLMTDGGNDLWELVRDRESGMMLTASTDNTVRSWEFSNDRLTPGPVTSDDNLLRPTDVVSVRGGQELIISSGDGRLHRADAATGALIPGGWTAALHTDEVIALETSQNGWLFSLADDQRVQVWQLLGESAAIDGVIADAGPVTDLALSPSATMIATTGPDGTATRDALSGATIAEFRGGGESVVFLSDQMVATGSADGVVQLWDAGSGALLAQANAHNSGAIRSIAASPNGDRLATGGADGFTNIWWIGEDNSLTLANGAGSSGEMTDLAFTPDGETVIGISFQQELTFWPVDDWDNGLTTLVDMDGPQALAVHPTEDLIAIGESFENVDIIDFDGNVISEMAPHPGGVWDLAFSADGLSLVAASRRNPAQIQLWDWASGVRLGPAFGEDENREEPDVVVGPDGTVWSSGLDGAIRRLDVLVLDVGCELSADVMDARMQQRFLGEEPPVSCGDAASQSGNEDLLGD